MTEQINRADDSSRKVIGVDPGHPDQESYTSYQYVDGEGKHWLIAKPGPPVPEGDPDYIVIEEADEVTPEQWEKIKAWARRDGSESHSFKVGDGKTSIQDAPPPSPEGLGFSTDLIEAANMLAIAVANAGRNIADMVNLPGFQVIGDMLKNTQDSIENSGIEKARERSRDDLKKKRQQLRRRKGKL